MINSYLEGEQSTDCNAKKFWLCDRLTDWMTNWSVEWLTCGLIDWLTVLYWWNDLLTDWFIDELIDILAWLIDWLINRLTNWLAFWRFVTFITRVDFGISHIPKVFQNYLEVQKLPRVSCFSSETLSHLGNLKSLRWGTRCSRVCRKQQRLTGHPCFKRSAVKVSILVPLIVCGNFCFH